MTQTTPAAPLDEAIQSLLAPHLEALSIHRQAFEVAATKLANAKTSAEKFQKAASAAAAEAADKSEVIRNEYRQSGGANTKTLVKLKSEQRAALESQEILASLEAEAKIEAGRAEIEMHRAANKYKSLQGICLTDSCKWLMDAFFSSLPPQILQILALNEAIAQRGLSVLYQEDQSVHSPVEYALREFGSRMRSAYKSNQVTEWLQQILPPAPDGIGHYGASPLTIQSLERNLGAIEQPLLSNDWRAAANQHAQQATLEKHLPSTL